MLPEYSTFISRHSLQTVCAQNYIIAALIEVSIIKQTKNNDIKNNIYIVINLILYLYLIINNQYKFSNYFHFFFFFF